MSCSGLGLSVVRPFTAQDVHLLNASFQEWDKFPPCLLPNTSNATQPQRTLELYFSGPAYAQPFSAATFFVDKPWRRCFESIKTNSAGLQPGQLETSPHLFAGGNMQFYRRAAAADVFLYMSARSVPAKPGWLGVLESEVLRQKPFSVLGARHVYASRWVATESVRNHLGPDSVYNTSATLIRHAVLMAEPLEFEPPESHWEPFERTLSRLRGSSSHIDGAERYGVSDAMSNRDGAVAVYDNASVVYGETLMVRAANQLDVTLVITGINFEKDVGNQPQTVAGFGTVVHVSTNVLFCNIVSVIQTSLFVIAAIDSWPNYRNMIVPVLESGAVLNFYKNWTGCRSNNYCFLKEGAVYYSDVAAKVCRDSAPPVTRDSYFDYAFSGFNVSQPQRSHFWANGMMAVNAELYAWPYRPQPFGLIRTARFNCRWPFWWEGVRYIQGECAFGGGPLGYWCPTQGAHNRVYNDWEPCEIDTVKVSYLKKHILLSAGASSQTEAMINDSLAESERPGTPFQEKERERLSWSIALLCAIGVVVIALIVAAVFRKSQLNQPNHSKLELVHLLSPIAAESTSQVRPVFERLQQYMATN